MSKQDLPTGIIILSEPLTKQELNQIKKKWIEFLNQGIPETLWYNESVLADE